MRKKLIILGMVFLSFFAYGDEVPKKIDIIQTISHPALDSTRKGVIDQLALEGFIDGKNVKIQFANAQGDLALSNQIAQKFASKNPDVIFWPSNPERIRCDFTLEG